MQLIFFKLPEKHNSKNSIEKTHSSYFGFVFFAA